MKLPTIRVVLLLVFSSTAGLLPAYAEDADIPREETSQIQRSATFVEISANPRAYQGQEIVVGGKVITARQYYDTTQIEVMQLPLGPGQEPALNEALTQGRFLAFQKAGLNPIGIPPGTRVTVVGEVAGSAVPDPNQAATAYPVLEVKTLTVWPASQAPPFEPAPAQLAPPPIAPVMPYPEPPVVIDQYYYTPYWDPSLSVWSWRPFWVFPWWSRPAIVAPPGAFIRPFRRHLIPFGPPPRRIGPLPPQFVPRNGPSVQPPRHTNQGQWRTDPNRIAPPQFNRRPSDGSQAVPPQFNRRSPVVSQAVPPQFNRRQADAPGSVPPQFGRRGPDGPRADFRGRTPNGNGSSQHGRGGRQGG